MATEEKKTTAPLEIVVDDGLQRVPIRNTQGEEIGVFFIRPTDIGIIQRFNEVAEKFPQITEPLENIGIKADGTAEDDGTDVAGEALKEAEKRLFEACDYLFGGNASEAFFGKMNPFSPVNGSFYCEIVLNAVSQFIAEQFSHETQKISKNVDKYVGKYGTGARRGKKK